MAEFIEVRSGNVNQKEPNHLQIVHSSESWGTPGQIHIMVLAMVPGGVTEDIRTAMMRHVYPMVHEVETMVVNKDPERIEAGERFLSRIPEIFSKAGFYPIFIEKIPNEYDKAMGYMPWVMVTTQIGHFKVGWRKRVLVLNWTKTLVHDFAERIFPKENVTKDDCEIHCWGYEKLQEYLTTVHDWYKQYGSMSTEP